jgi:glucan phosphoethanolaminetransferase (alkaline phosphatase superfamily)
VLENSFNRAGKRALDPWVGDTFVSILPCWHIFERTAEYFTLSRGVQMVSDILIYIVALNLSEVSKVSALTLLLLLLLLLLACHHCYHHCCCYCYSIRTVIVSALCSVNSVVHPASMHCKHIAIALDTHVAATTHLYNIGVL